MPVSKIEIDSILGLTTSSNETSGINSPAWSSMSAWSTENSSSGATSPNSLLDCSNIIISRNKQAAARTAFVEVWDFTSTYGSVAAFNTYGIYAIPNSTTDSLQFTWKNATTANIANFTNSVDVTMESSVNIINGATSSSFTAKTYLAPDFGWYSTASVFPIKSFNLTRFASSYSNIYVFSSNGVFRTTLPYIRDTTVASYNQFKKVVLPVVRNLSATINPTPTDASRWFESGYLCNIQIVVTDQLTSSQTYQGKPSRVLTVTNTGTVSSILLTFSVDNTNLALDSGAIAVYRTVSYSPTDLAPPSKYFKCYEAALQSGTVDGTKAYATNFTDIELILNNTSLQQFEQIYTSLNVESTDFESAQTAAAPTARDVITYNNFSVYGNVMCPPFATLTMTALPNTDNLDQLTIGATTVAITYTPNSTVPPANDGVIDATTGTYTGVNSSPNAGKGYNLVIRPQDPTVATGPTLAKYYGVPYYAIADNLALNTGSGNTQNIVVTPKDGEVFDIGRFDATGFVAVIATKTTGNVIALFSYQSYEQIPASGYYKFSNCVAYGVPFSDAIWTATLPTAGQTRVLYALSSTSATTLPVYSIGSDVETGVNANKGFSLLPTYELYPTRRFNQQFVGTITSFGQNGATTPVLASIDFNGLFSKNSGQLLDACVKTLCDTYNTARAPEDPYAVYDDSTTAPVGRIRFEGLYSGYNSFSTYTTNASYTNGVGYYDSIYGRVYRASGAITVKFAEPIPVYPTAVANIMQQKVQTIAGLTVSKVNKPEEIPISQNLTPYIVGDPLKPIIKMVNQLNTLLIFKQNDGTYRADIEPSGPSNVIPSLKILTLVDNTAWLLLPESVQVFEGTVIYFSNKAFVSITIQGQVREISPSIATELLTNYSRIYNEQKTDSVRSWIIAQQRLYCCYFPNVNDDLTSVTYVFSFNTGQWTKWSGEIRDAVVSDPGQLTLIENIWTMGSRISDYDQIQSEPLDLLDRYWLVMRQADFQTPSESQIEDSIPFTSFTVQKEVGTDAFNIRISGFGTSGVYKNLYKLLSLYKNRTMWYLSATQGYFSCVLVNAASTYITVQLVNNVYERNIINPEDLTVSTADSLITTVNTQIFFNKFFISTPRGSTISHYNEVQLYMQQGQDYSNIALGFNSTAVASEYIYVSSNPVPAYPTGPVANSIIVTTTGSFVILSTTTYDIYAPYYVLASSQYSFRALVPLDSARGRFIQIGILHDTPDEVFILNSIVYIYRDLNSTKIRAHS